MANLPETSTWEAGIYQLETDDPVLGGADGISNQQAKQLANRTNYLKNIIETAQTITDFNAAIIGGTYYAAETALNAPNDVVPFTLYVAKNGDYISQIAYEASSTIYLRTGSDGGADWSPWVGLTTNNSLTSVYAAISAVFVPTTFTGNLNTVTDSDIYFVTKTGSSNLPSDLTGYTLDNFFMEVRKSGTYVEQTVFGRTAEGKASIYVRTSTNTGSTWSAWNMQANTSMLQHDVDLSTFDITVGVGAYTSLNFNSLATGGQYTIDTGSAFASVTNPPPGLTANSQTCILEVIHTSGGTAKVVQKAYTLHNNNMYFRTNLAGTWSAWKTVTAT